MAGLPIVGLDAALLQHRIGQVKAGGFHIDHELRVLVYRRQVAGQQHADLVGENLMTLVIDHAAAVAIAVEAQAEIGAAGPHRIAHGVQHVKVFGIGIVFGEGEIQFVVHRDHFRSDSGQRFRREGARRAVAGGANHLDRPRQADAARHVAQIGLAHIGHGDIGAARALFPQPAQHDLLQPGHLVRPESQRTLRAHLHPGPAILVMAGRHHRHGGTVQRELSEVGHRRQRQPNVMDLAARPHQPQR